MELEGSSKGPQRLILPCADDDGNFMCYICRSYAPSAKTLYNHLKSSSCYYRWRSVLPKKLSDCSTVVVRHTLLTPDSSIKEDGECSLGGNSTTRFLPEWNSIGKMRTKRRRPHDDHTKAAPSLSNKSKVAADIVADTKNDRVVAEAVGLPEKVAPAEMAAGGGGKVVLDVDLNIPVMMELADDQ